MLNPFWCLFFHLSVITTALITFAPIVIICLVVLHKETLQKNFIALHTIEHPKQAIPEWPDTLIRCALSMMSNDQTFQCIIQYKDDLQSMLDTPELLNCPLSTTMLNIIMKSTLLQRSKLLWISSEGTIKAINTDWKKNSIEAWLTKEVQQTESWKQNALFFTSKTDAVFLSIDTYTRTFTLIKTGKIIEKLSAQSALALLKYMQKTPDITHSLPGELHGNTFKKTGSEQSLS